MKVIGIGLLVIVGIVALAFGTGLLDLGMLKYFGVRRANVKREIFEQSKSYSHGKTAQLAKYYEEYNEKESIEDKEAIASLIKMNFSDFDESKIRNNKLKNFLTNIRGY